MYLMELIELEKSYLLNYNLPIVNALRRIIISEIPTYAIQNVNTYCNISVMSGEQLSHRLCLIPITYSELSEEELTDFVLSLHVRNDNDIILHVTSEQLKSNNEKIVPIYDDILIIKLKKGQEINLKCTISKNIGQDHNKHSCVSSAYCEKTEEGINLTIESLGIFSCDDILLKAKEILVNKLLKIKY